MKKLFIIVFVVFAGLGLQAQENKNKNAKHDVEVKGNCDQCKKRIEKAAYEVKGVKMAQWEASKQSLHLVLDESKCSATDVKKSVAKAGHDTNGVKATDEAYSGLHYCCQYDRQ